MAYRRFVNWLICLVLVGLFSFPLPANARILQNDTFADISCHTAPLRVITKGWGVDYPRSIQIEVDELIYIDNKFWTSKTRRVFTTSSGSWSVSTDTRFTFLRGRYDYTVTVERVSNGQWLGSDFDSCTL